MAASTVSAPAIGSFKAAAKSFGLFSTMVVAKSETNCLNLSLEATKSVSELTSNKTARLSATLTAAKPSAAIRLLFFAALATPFSRNSSMAFCISPSAATSAFLASIIPTLVLSRSSFT